MTCGRMIFSLPNDADHPNMRHIFTYRCIAPHLDPLGATWRLYTTGSGCAGCTGCNGPQPGGLPVSQVHLRPPRIHPTPFLTTQTRPPHQRVSIEKPWQHHFILNSF